MKYPWLDAAVFPGSAPSPGRRDEPDRDSLEGLAVRVRADVLDDHRDVHRGLRGVEPEVAEDPVLAERLAGERAGLDRLRIVRRS